MDRSRSVRVVTGEWTVVACCVPRRNTWHLSGEFKLFAYDTKTRAVRQLTNFDDFPVLNLDAGGGNLVFEQAGGSTAWTSPQAGASG